MDSRIPMRSVLDWVHDLQKKKAETINPMIETRDALIHGISQPCRTAYSCCRRSEIQLPNGGHTHPCRMPSSRNCKRRVSLFRIMYLRPLNNPVLSSGFIFFSCHKSPIYRLAAGSYCSANPILPYIPPTLRSIAVGLQTQPGAAARTP